MSVNKTAIALGSALAAISLAAGAVSMTINIGAGMKVSASTAVIYGASDAARIIIPLVAVFVTWTMQLRIAFASSIFVSLLAIATHLADATAKDMVGKDTGNRVRAEVMTKVAAAKTELARIDEMASAASLAQSARLQEEVANREESNGGCRIRCIDARREAAKLRERQGIAERRELLEKVVSDNVVTTDKAEEVTSGVAVLLSGTTGLDESLAAKVQRLIELAAFVFMMENMVYLIIPATKVIRSGFCAREDVILPAVDTREDVREDVREEREDVDKSTFRPFLGVREDVREDSREEREDSREEDILPDFVRGRIASSLSLRGKAASSLNQLVALALENESRCITASRRDLATMTGVSQTAMAQWMKAVDGVLFDIIATNGGKTTWKLRI